MYESFKEYKKGPGRCPICDKPTISKTSPLKGNTFPELVTCSGCKSSWQNIFVLSFVDKLKLSPAAKKMLKDRQDRKEKEGDIEIDTASPSGRILAGV